MKREEDAAAVRTPKISACCAVCCVRCRLLGMLLFGVLGVAPCCVVRAEPFTACRVFCVSSWWVECG